MNFTQLMLIRRRLGADADATRIFISHSSKDSGVATLLADLLRRSMGGRWYVFNSSDVYTLHPGLAWEEAVTTELDRTNSVVLLLSPHSLNSRWVRKELGIALKRSVSVSSVHYGNRPSVLPPPFEQQGPLLRLDEGADVRLLLRDLRAQHRRVQRLSGPAWERFHEFMDEHSEPLISEFLRGLKRLAMKELLTLDPLEFDRSLFPSFESYISFSEKARQRAPHLTLMYSSADEDVAALLAALVRRVFIDRWRIAHSCDAPSAEETQVVLLLLSKDAVQSETFRRGFAEAVTAQHPVLPVVFGPLEAEDLPDIFAWLQTRRLDLVDEVASLLHALRDLRSDLLGRSGSKVWWVVDLFGGRNDEDLGREFVSVLLHHLNDTRGVARPPA